MSPATVKRRAEKFAHIRKMVRGKGITKPGNIRSIIPIRTGPWDEALVGTINRHGTERVMARTDVSDDAKVKPKDEHEQHNPLDLKARD